MTRTTYLTRIIAFLLFACLLTAVAPVRLAVAAVQNETMTPVQMTVLPDNEIIGGSKMRKKIIGKETLTEPVRRPGELDIAAIATVMVTSEEANFPIENAFDNQRGPGGSRWVAAEPDEQTLILVFDAPQTLHQISLEVEELEVSRTQALKLSVSQDGGNTYRELFRQEYNFSPPGTMFEREEWSVSLDSVTHLYLWIKPDKSSQPCRATLTSLVLQ